MCVPCYGFNLAKMLTRRKNIHTCTAGQDHSNCFC